MRLYFAGGEAWADLLLTMGVKNQLFSYFYLRSALHGRASAKAQTLVKRMERAKKKGYSFFLDSGAFTYQAKSGKAALPPPAAYFREYTQFCKEYGELFDIIAELDIDGCIMPNGKVIETQQIDEWTNNLIADIGYKVMPVYHHHRGIKWMHHWLLDTSSPYVGFSSDTVEGAGQAIAMAHRYGKFIHGFAQTRINTDAKHTPFDSVDSTTWLRADKYGGTCIFRNGKWIVLDHLHKHQRAIYKDWYASWGLDFSLIAKDDLHENRKATITAWRELANSLESKAVFRNRGKLPYLLQMHLDGHVPDEHPMLTALKQREP